MQIGTLKYSLHKLNYIQIKLRDVQKVDLMVLVDKTNTISLEELNIMSEKMFDHLVKAVVDTQKGIMFVDALMHADMENHLLNQGSSQGDLWGINIHPTLQDDDWIEFDSLINLRPSWGNRSRGVDDQAMQKHIRDIVTELVKK